MTAMASPSTGKKLEGRAFYESIGSPKVVLAPMVDQSEFAWRMLSRSFLPSTKDSDSQERLLAYTPMFHARLFGKDVKYRSSAFEPIREPLAAAPNPDTPLQQASEQWHLDGDPAKDRPLVVQFCANDPDEFLAAARFVQPYCDAVDLNLGCPQGIAKKGHYGAFLQEDRNLIFNLVNKLHRELSIPVTAKMRCLETKEQTLEYAKVLLSAGASIITVHGRERHQKGHITGVADWSKIRYLRDNLPPETVIFANGNILQHDDIEECLKATGADAVMSAEGNLYDPSIFAKPPPVGQEGSEYWRDSSGLGGFRMDAVLRRYLDIVYRHVLGVSPPERKPLFVLGDNVPAEPTEDEQEGPPKKKARSEKKAKSNSPNLGAMQPHLFHLLRPLVSKHTHVRDALARARAGDMEAFENVLSLVENVVARGLQEYAADPALTESDKQKDLASGLNFDADIMTESSMATVARCRRPWFVCQPYVRPLPDEALRKGAITLSKKDQKSSSRVSSAASGSPLPSKAGMAKSKAIMKEIDDNVKEGVKKAVEKAEKKPKDKPAQDDAEFEVPTLPVPHTETVQTTDESRREESIEVPKRGMVCG